MLWGAGVGGTRIWFLGRRARLGQGWALRLHPGPNPVSDREQICGKVMETGVQAWELR